MTQPDILTTPFGENAAPETINPIPSVRQPSDDPQQATWSEGFPRVTMQPLVTGGIPPKGQDFNGILRSLSEHIVFQNSGGQYRWSNDWVSQKGGYSLGDVVQSDDGLRSYVSVVNNNTVNFNTTPSAIGDTWLPWSGGAASELIGGLIQLATAAEAQAFTGKRAITPETLGSAMNAHVLGMGQAWQDMTESRSLGTTYTNTTGRTIAAWFYVSVPPATVLTVSVQASAVDSARASDNSTGDRRTLKAIVPPGATYGVNRSAGSGTAELFRVMELR